MKLFKRVIKKLALKYLSERDIKDLLWKNIFVYPEKIDWQETRELFTKIFNENPRLREYINIRKSQLLNDAFEEEKSYIRGAIGELQIIESLYSPKENESIKITESKNINEIVDRFLNYFKGRNQE